MDKPALTNMPEQTGILVADAQMVAMAKAYSARAAQNTNLFLKRHCDQSPEMLGELLADVQASAKRDALLGFLWRWLLIGGGAGFAALFVDLLVALAVVIFMIPAALALALRK